MTAPQPLGLSGPTAQGHLMTTGIQETDLIPPQALLMNTHEMQSYYNSLANNTTKGLPNGSILYGESPTCQPTIDLLQFIVKQVQRRSGLCSKQEPSAGTLWHDLKRMASPTTLTVLFGSVKTTITVRQSKSNEDLEIGKQFAPLWRELADHLEIFFPNRDDEGAVIIPELDTRLHVLSIKDLMELENQCSNLPPLGSGQTFTLVTPELSVPGVPPAVLQRELSSQHSQCV